MFDCSSVYSVQYFKLQQTRIIVELNNEEGRLVLSTYESKSIFMFCCSTNFWKLDIYLGTKLLERP